MKKVFSLLLSFIMLISTIACTDFSAFAEINDTISVGETKTVTIENGGDYYYFSFTPEADGSYIFCSTGDNDTYGALYDSEMYVLASNDDGIGLNFLILYNFEAGKTYIFGCKYLDGSATGSFDVALTENTVTGISFTPAAELKFVENNNGFWDYDDNNEEYFYYNIPWFSYGDVLTVTDKDGNSVDYTFSHDEYAFVSENGEILDGNSLHLFSDQYSNPWTVGGDNFLTVQYMGVSTQIPVTIVENPVASISFTPASPITFFENSGGVWGTNENGEYYDYTIPWFDQGDILTVTDKNGNSVDYTYNSDSDIFVSENGEIIKGNSLKRISNQYSNPWTVGDDNYFTVEYAGTTAQVPVTIVENPVASISFTPASPITFFENCGGVWETNENGEYYEYNIPWYSQGDMLTVTDNDGNSVDYTYNSESNTFVSESGESIEVYVIHLNSNQHENPWTIGSDNYFTVEYMGETVQVPVTIVENPVAGISFTPASPITILEKNGGYWNTNDNGEYYEYYIPWHSLGNVLTITDKNGNSVDYTLANCYDSDNNYLRDAFISENGELIEIYELQANSNQYFNPWTIGSDNYFTIEYMGKTAQVPVTIVKEQEHTHSYTAVITDPTANTRGYTTYTCECGDSYIDDYTDYASDNSVLLAVLEQIESYSDNDFSASTFENLKNIYDSYSSMAYGSFAQTEIDNAVFDLLTALSYLQPYLNLNISSSNGIFTVTYNDETNSSAYSSLLFGTNVALTATANDGYEFVGWYDTVNNLYFSRNPEYSFKITTNTSLKAVFVKEQSATLTFTTYSGWVQSTVTKTIDEWNSVTSIDDLLPEVPYKYGYSNGRWVYDNAEVLAKLQTGENVTLIPEYDEDDTSLPTPPSPDGDTPVLDLYYKLDAEANVGSFVMAAGIPEDCQLESVGIAFYYEKADKFDPTKFELLINNKMLTGRFNTDEIEDIYIVNMNRMAANYNWAARGYVTYYDAGGNLKTVYSNQVNIVNREQV